ncbi:MAG: YdiU family protein, partial [Bacteroidales bacterium]|nr:YdiU family protein [Bacteroidales bacterium]
PLLKSDENAQASLEAIENNFYKMMQTQMVNMWAAKLGLDTFDAALFRELEILMHQTTVDYTLFFRELSHIPEDIQPLKKSFYNEATDNETLERWSQWLKKWKVLINTSSLTHEEISKKMKLTNPKYTLREWFLVPAYQQAYDGDYTLIRELQEVMTNPYDEQSKEIEDKYYRLKPSELFQIAGISHISCSS